MGTVWEFIVGIKNIACVFVRNVKMNPHCDVATNGFKTHSKSVGYLMIQARQNNVKYTLSEVI